MASHSNLLLHTTHTFQSLISGTFWNVTLFPNFLLYYLYLYFLKLFCWVGLTVPSIAFSVVLSHVEWAILGFNTSALFQLQNRYTCEWTTWLLHIFFYLGTILGFNTLFSEACVSHSSEVRVEGLDTLDYHDNLQSKIRCTEQGDAVVFESEVSFVYASYYGATVVRH